MSAQDQIRALGPQFASTLDSIHALANQKLWHQMTDALEKLLVAAELGLNQLRLRLFNEFVLPNIQRLNPLRGALLAVEASSQISSPAESIQFLQTRISDLSKVREDCSQADVVLRVAVASATLALGSIKEARDLLEACRNDVEGLQDVDERVFSIAYRASALYLKQYGTSSEFYRMALLYLAYTPIERMSVDEQRLVAFDVGLAALLGDSVYNFGELLAHPAVRSLEGTQYEWLAKMLVAFHRGDIVAYENLVASHRTQMEALPVLLNNAAQLKTKIQLMALVELVFRRFPGQRELPFSDVACVTNEPVDLVEVLVMKALSLDLIRGSIDQVLQTIRVEWVQPRVLDRTQIRAVREKFDHWINNVHEALVFLEKETPELVA
eukprot:ANDGO_02317.mRNA.1 hypothetical protein